MYVCLQVCLLVCLYFCLFLSPFVCLFVCPLGRSNASIFIVFGSNKELKKQACECVCLSVTIFQMFLKYTSKAQIGFRNGYEASRMCSKIREGSEGSRRLKIVFDQYPVCADIPIPGTRYPESVSVRKAGTAAYWYQYGGYRYQ